MSHTMDRRDFLRKVVAISASATILQSLAACGRPDAPAPEATATDVPASPTIPPATAAQTAASPTQTAAPAVATPAAAPSVAPSATPAPADIVAAHGPGASPTELTRRAIAALGGMGLFVHDGDDVIVKPNICNAYNGPEYASTTNPEVVAALVTLALEAGAKRVRVMDAPFSGTAQAAYAKSGIADAVNAAGGTMELMSPW